MNLSRGVLLLLAALAGPWAQATVGQAYGFGGRTAALAGAGVAWGFESFASYSNPAGLPFSAPEDRHFSFSFGVISMIPSFLSIDNVYVENNYVSDKLRPGNINNDYRSTFGQMMGLTYRLSTEGHWTFGVTTFLPINQLAFMDSGEAFYPEYVLYRAQTQRPQLEAGLGGDLGPSFHVGAGLHLAFSLTANATVFLNSNKTKPSTMRFSSSIKPKVSPYLGVLWTPAEKTDLFTLGAVIRFPAKADATMVLSSGARVFGNLAALDFNFTALSALFYDPLSIEVGTSWEHAKGWRLYGQLDYQFWSKFDAPALQIQNPEISSCTDTGTGDCSGLSISPGQNPSFPYQNILIPRIAEEISLGETTLRIGYGYRPSIFAALPTGAGNYLDPPKHMVTLGVGLQFKHFLSTPYPAKLDFDLAYHRLITQHVEKEPGNEAGTAGDYKIGAPGYDAGGKILGGGVSLSLSI